MVADQALDLPRNRASDGLSAALKAHARVKEAVSFNQRAPFALADGQPLVLEDIGVPMPTFFANQRDAALAFLKGVAGARFAELQRRFGCDPECVIAELEAKHPNAREVLA